MKIKDYEYFRILLNMKKDAVLIRWLLGDKDEHQSAARAVKAKLYKLMKQGKKN